MDGEVSRTAERIGEATALALASSLYAATEQIKGRAPRSVRDLLSGLAARNLLPPGLAITQEDAGRRLRRTRHKARSVARAARDGRDAIAYG
jgi:hypothetical protein